VKGLIFQTEQKVCFATSRNFDARGASVTSEERRREWVSIAMSWGSRFGDPLWKLGQKLGGRKTDGDAVGGLDDGDGADSERDPIRVDSMPMAFGMD